MPACATVPFKVYLRRARDHAPPFPVFTFLLMPACALAGWRSLCFPEACMTPDSTNDKISAWSLIRPYWFSEDRWRALALLVFIISMNMALVYINVRLNAWQAGFYDTLTKKDVGGFRASLIEFSILAFLYIIIYSFRTYFRQMLEFRWRQWLTDRYLLRWLGDNAFYRIERDKLADNPDQRISDDLQALAT